jgi:hypothetical protein
MPVLCEAFFQSLDARITIQPVMNIQDLKTGLGKLKA